MKKDQFQTYTEFWPFYLSQHSKRATRLLHVLGTAVGMMLVVVAIIRLDPVWLIFAATAGYGFAWIGHALIEKNRPATFSHPLWSLRGDFHMMLLWVTGRLRAEVFHQKQLDLSLTASKNSPRPD